MEIEVDVKPVGNHFKKENIFLGILMKNGIDESNNLVKQMKERYPFFSEETIVKMVNEFILEGVVEIEECDIFYKTEKGYTSFSEEGALTLKGDNSDGKGIIKNLVPIWDYYYEDEVFEVTINGETILSADYNPMKKYNRDYNSRRKVSKRLRKIK